MEFDPPFFFFHFFAMASSDFDIRILSSDLKFVPVETRMPLKFGAEVLTSVTCARSVFWCGTRDGNESFGWGETPLSVQWVWPSSVAYGERLDALLDFLAQSFPRNGRTRASLGMPLEIGHSLCSNACPVSRLLQS